MNLSLRLCLKSCNLYYRASKVYYLEAQWLDSSLVTFNVYRTSKVYYLAAQWLDGSLVMVNYY